MSKENLHLPKTAFSMKANLPNKEPYILDKWEKLPSLNGTTVRKYNRIIQNNEFKEIFRGKPPIFGDGRMAEKYFVFKLLKYICWLPAQIPILNELFLGIIVSVLKKD